MKQLSTMIAAACLLAAVPASAESQTSSTRGKYAAGPIYEATGDVKDYIKTYDGCFAYMDIEYLNGQEVKTQIVWGDDNCVYFPDIISMMPTGSYTKGTINGNRITVALPQTLIYEEYEYDGELIQSFITVNLLKSEEENGHTMFYPAEEETEITFTVAEDGTVFMNPLAEGYVLGLVVEEDGFTSWMGFAESAMTFTPDNGSGSVDPSTLENIPYSYFTRGYDTPDTAEPEYGYKVNVAFDGDDVYFTGLSIDEPSWWVKGHREGNQVILDNNQEMGTLSIYNVSLMFGKYDPEAYGGMSLLPADTKFIFNFDEEKKTFTTATPEVIMIINAQPDRIMALWMLEDPTFIYQPNAAGNPRDPWNFTFDAAMYDRIGYGIFDFYLPIVSTDGVLLDRSDMYYQIYLDGEVYELDAAEYGLPGDSENVPYNFDKEAIVCSKLSTYHEMIFHAEGFDKIGVKLFNVYDGVTYESNLVEMDVVAGEITTAVNEIAGNANVVSETYYDLSGRRVSNPQSGVLVKRTVYDDGTVINKKYIRR